MLPLALPAPSHRTPCRLECVRCSSLGVALGHNSPASQRDWGGIGTPVLKELFIGQSAHSHALELPPREAWGAPCRLAGLASALQGAHSPRCETKLLATSAPFPQCGSDSPWRLLDRTASLVPFSFFPWLLLSGQAALLWLPECCPGAPGVLGSGRRSGWICYFEGSFTQVSCLSCPISNLETPARTATWSSGSRQGRCLALCPLPGAGRTVEVSKERETSEIDLEHQGTSGEPCRLSGAALAESTGLVAGRKCKE